MEDRNSGWKITWQRESRTQTQKSFDKLGKMVNVRPRLPPPSCNAQPTLTRGLTLTLSALLLKRPIRRMVVRIGSEESSSILWVHTGGKDCRCRGHTWGGGQGRDMLNLGIQRDYNSHQAVGQQAQEITRSYRLSTWLYL